MTEFDFYQTIMFYILYGAAFFGVIIILNIHARWKERRVKNRRARRPKRGPYRY